MSEGLAIRRWFDQAVSAFQQRHYAEALPPLEKAAAAGDAEARNLLGVMCLNGLGVLAMPERAAQLFQQAAEAGLKEADYNLANLLFNGLGTAADQSRAQLHLIAAARAGHRGALRSLGMLYHAAGDAGQWPVLASRCFRAAAQAGDPHAQYMYGFRLLRGLGVDPDLHGAAQNFAAAARSGLYLAASRLAQLQPTIDQRPAAPDHWDEAELDVVPLQPIADIGSLRTVSFLSEYPRVLDECFCDHLINISALHLIPSRVVHPTTGAATRSELRTSYSMQFQPSMYDVPTGLALRRMAHIAGLPATHAEPMGVLRYGPGQEYRPHYDYYTDDQHQAQRLTTVFVYLNQVEEGGGTDFPRLGVRVDPERGKAVRFTNLHPDGKPDADTLHAGLPVIRGEKWLATLWFWDRPFDWFR